MKKILNKKGFALVETLIAAVSVISIFTLLYNLVFPLVGSSRVSQNYDDLDSKYVAFYLKEMLETDSNLKLSTLINDGTHARYITYLTYGYITEENGKTTRVDDISSLNINNDGERSHIILQNELCDLLSDDKNNKFICNMYIAGANITKVYLTTYEVNKDLKEYIKSDTNLSRAFKKYIEYMPTHIMADTSKKNNYHRIIVEIEHDAFNSVSDKYYTYATIEVKN